MKSLLLLGSSLSILLGGVQETSSRSHVVKEDTYEITYKYETNEVNSADDLVVGRIYHYVNDFSSLPVGSEFVECLAIYNVKALRQTIDTFYNVNTTLKLQKLSESNFDIFATNPTNRIGRIYVENNILECDIVYSNLFQNDVFSNYSICTNNIIENVSSVTHDDSVLGYVYDFVYNDILDIPNIDNFSFEVFGSHTSLRNYLTITICIVLAILLIWLLIWFVRYLFRLFAGLLYR